jgi:peptidoglycan-N-acetylglucosamine deacetylase
MSNKRQIFQTDNATRWKSFIWIFRIIAVIMILGISAIVISLLHKKYFKIPDFSVREAKYQQLSKAVIQASLKPKDRINFNKSLEEIRKQKRHDFYKQNLEKPVAFKRSYPIRAGFYVNWDIQSFYSLKANIKKMNMILPEWFFVDSTDKINVKVDKKVLNLLRYNKVAIIPIVSNFMNQKWNGENIHRIFISANKRRIFINSIIDALDQYHFHGVNIDFEDLKETTDENIVEFQNELYSELHKKGYLVCQDVAPFNKDYNYENLNKFNDFIFLMGYDQHNKQSMPGPIAENLWVEKAMDEICKKIPQQKIVLCIAAYGYDWAVGYVGENISFQGAINRVLANNADIKFDNNSYNLTFSYTDEGDKLHKVYFTDAISGFNFMRIAEDFGAAGVALWRLGSEDPRIWKFYKQSLNMDTLKQKPFNFSVLKDVHSAYNVDFIGRGEVLDIISTPHTGNAILEIDRDDQLISEEKYKQLPSGFIIERNGVADKKIALTFDDGPDRKFTPEILKILKKNKIHATFFVTGVNAENNLPILEQIYDEGHEIGDHTYSHPNIGLISPTRVRLELRLTRILIESITGHSTILFRPPYNTDAQPENPEEIAPITIAKDENFICVSAAIDPNDWIPGIDSDTILYNVEHRKNMGNILLLHDAGGDRTQTVIALPEIIQYFRDNGYQFVTISELINKKSIDVMPKVSKMDGYTGVAEMTIFRFTYIYQHFLYGLFFLTLILIFSRLVFIAFIAILNRYKLKKKPVASLTSFPLVSIIVPAYNEEVTAKRAVDNLLLCDYPAFEIVFVDDGSHDNTYKIINQAFSDNSNVKVFTKPNGGKASALNFGIQQASGEFLVCIDADTLLNTDAVSKMMQMFTSHKIAAVAGNVKVGNRVNMLTNWQSIEYTTSQNFDRLAFDYVNAIMVIPGAIGTFRKSAIIEAGGFTTDTLAEDCDLTLRLLKCGYKVRTCNDAISLTEAPETLKMFYKQRFRWTFGIMQSFWKHRSLLFTHRKPNMGWILLPNMLIFQMILPIFSPIVDLLTIYALFTANAPEVILAYFIFFAVDCIISFHAFKYDKQKFTIRSVFYLFVQRIVYRQFLFYVLIKSYLKALKGELASWGILKRTGNVTQEE